MPNKIREERLCEMNDNWSAETNDPETETWRDDLTPEEARIVADWDVMCEVGIHRLCKAILAEGGLYG